MKKSPSLFFPLVLIAAGVVWLLVQMNYIPLENLWALAHIWPFLLIALGLGLILRSILHESVGMVISVLVVLGAVFAILYAPQLGWTDVPTKMSDDFSGSIAGSGNIKTETRETESFDKISIKYPADVTVVQGDVETVKIEADDNLLPQLIVEVSGGKLVLKNKDVEWTELVKPSQSVKVTITVKDLTQVELPSSGKINIENLKSNSLSVDLSGAGKINLIGLDVKNLNCQLNSVGSINADGEASQTNIEINGFGNFNGKDLQTSSADATINGAGSITLKVKTSLTAEINGAGSVRYYGSPKINSNINGAGSVSQLGK